MDARALIAGLRAGRAPDAGALRDFARGLADGRVSDAQAGAFAMAACLNGLGPGGAVALTLAMRDSGDVLAWDLPGPVMDKHSTGGIGDPVSLLLAPMLASLGCYVPMISGRGLGHSGGTLDKLESIPGLSCEVDEARLRAIVGDLGCAIVAATDRIAPADRRLYAIRDVTGTVDDIDLITASILSKKLAAGIGTLVLDVKAGSGAFMASVEDAERLARQLVDTAQGAGCRSAALITDMNQPLAGALGNALEIRAVLAALSGGDDSPLVQVAVELGAVLLDLAGTGGTRAQLLATLHSGAAAEKFAAMIAALGGPSDLFSQAGSGLPLAPVIRDVPAPAAGHVTAIDGVALGMAVVHLGGGRLVETDRIDPAVGLSDVVRLGQKIEAGAPLARVHAATGDMAERAAGEVTRAVSLGPPLAPPPLIRRDIR